MKNIRYSSLLAAGILVGVAAALPARAVVLQQQWQAGQSLSYDLSMNGTTNLKVPEDAPVFFAGVPLEIEVKGQGLATLQTIEVDEMGNGTIFFDLPKFDANAQAFGQKARFELREGKTRFLLNGKAIALGGDDKNAKAGAAQTPAKRYALVIGTDGRVKNYKELDPIKPMVAPAKTATTTQVADETVDAADAINKDTFFTSVILQALPTLWPKKDVQTGETWETKLALPTALARDAAAAAAAPPLSKWTMTLKGEELVDGVNLWRVGVIGGVQVNGKQLPAPQTPKQGAAPAMQLDSLVQNVNGDLWFDAAKGRVVRGEFVVDARGQSHSINDKGRASDPSWADFTGTFGMKLNETPGK